MAKELKRRRVVRERKKKEETTPAGTNALPSYEGKVEVGDVVAYRWLGGLLAGRVREIKEPERQYIDSEGNAISATPTLYFITEREGKTVYPIRKENILHKYTDEKLLEKCKHWK